jgi:transposase
MMKEKKVIENYNDGVSEIISLMKDMNSGLTSHINNLNGELVSLNQEIRALREENKSLYARIAELEAKLNKNSNNSSKPPSTDNHKKPANNRKKTGRSPGGQDGHEGKTLLKVNKPDKVIDIKPEACECGCNLSHIEGRTETRQVFEVPIITINVTEYRTHEVVCPKCNKVHKTDFPETITQPVQYGDNLQALMVYLSNYQLVPLGRTTEIIKTLTGHNISQGTIVNATKRLYDNLEKVEKAIKEQLKKADLLHTDESGMRSQGKTNWVHTASTENLTYYAMHKKRGSQATKDIGILPEFKGTMMHDHWKPYYTFTDCTHAECNAHHVRNLKGIHENYGHEWAQDMASLLVEIKRAVDTLKDKGLNAMAEGDIKAYVARYNSIITKGKAEDAAKGSGNVSKKTGKPLKSNALRLLEKLEEYDIETLAFLYDFSIPFDNNLAERDIRMVKLRQKISGCFRGDNGGKWFCRIRSYISTCRKNGQDVMESLKKAVKGEPFIPET